MLTCPECGATMRADPVGDSPREVCPSCDGAWLPGAGRRADAAEANKADRRLLLQYSVARALSVSATTEEVAPRLLEILCDHLGCDMGVLWQLHREDDCLRLVASFRRPKMKGAGIIELARSRPIHRGLCVPGQVWQDGEPVFVPNVQADPRCLCSAMATDGDVHAAWGFPIRFRGEVLGVFELFGRSIGLPDAGALQMISAVTDQVGQFLGRSEAERASRISQARRAAIFDAAIDAVITIDHQGRILELNPAAEQIFGFTREQVEGRPLAETLIPPSLREAHLRGLARYLETGEGPVLGRRTETEAQHANGSTLPVELVVTRVPSNGAPHFTGFVRDITARKQAMEDLSEERERLTVTLRSIAEAVITTDTDARVVLMNRAAEHMTGWSHVEAVGRKLQEVFHIVDERSRAPIPNPVERVLETGRAIALGDGAVLIARDGTERLIADSGAPIRHSHRRITGVVLVFRDYSNERRLHDELVKAGKLESLGVLAGGIAHDFNNLLTAILGNISVARLSTSVQDRVHERLVAAELACERGRMLTRQLLTFATGGEPLRDTTSVGELLRAAADFVLRSSYVQCDLRISPELSPVEADQGQLAQVFHNVLMNATQAMPGGGTLRIRAEDVWVARTDGLPLKPGAYVDVTVEDEGEGIAPETLSRVFDPFFTTKGTGSGLGLTTAHSILVKHDGHITIDSVPGAGTTVHMYLPVSRGRTRRARSVSGHVQRARILVLEDEWAIRELLGVSLEELGHHGTFTSDGSDAVTRYRDALHSGQPFDVVLLDLTIVGGMGGKETLDRIRELDPGVRAIVTTGYSDDTVFVDHLRFGFCAKLAKPFRVQDLDLALREALGPDSPVDPTPHRS